MKKIRLMCLLVGMMCIGNVNAQTTIKDKMKQRAELMEQNRKLQEMKVSDASLEQAKEFKADGWKVMPGRLPLEHQIERAALLQNQFEEDLLTPAYAWGEATSEAEHYDAGLFQALELARLNLAGNIQSNVTQLVSHKLGNKQESADLAQSISSSMSKSKSFVTQRLGQMNPVVSTYRLLPSGSYQIRVMTFCSMVEARRLAVDAVKNQSEKDAQQLEKILFDE